MKRKTNQSVLLGDLVAAAFDEAAGYGADAEETSLLATLALMDLLRRGRRISVTLPLAVRNEARGAWSRSTEARAAAR